MIFQRYHFPPDRNNSPVCKMDCSPGTIINPRATPYREIHLDAQQIARPQQHAFVLGLTLMSTFLDCYLDNCKSSTCDCKYIGKSGPKATDSGTRLPLVKAHRRAEEDSADSRQESSRLPDKGELKYSSPRHTRSIFRDPLSESRENHVRLLGIFPSQSMGRMNQFEWILTTGFGSTIGSPESLAIAHW